MGQLYERYGYLVYRRCLAILGSPDDANDALQETFMRAQRYYNPEVAQVLPWLYSVAYRCCLDLTGRRSRAERWTEGLLRGLRERVAGPSAERVISAETRLTLGEELSRLDEKSRAIALLHFLEGLTQEEVAERTGYSRKTVGVKLKRIEERFREVFTLPLEGDEPCS